MGHTSDRSAESGVGLIDTIVGSALLLIVFLGVAAMVQYSLFVIGNSKARSGAIALNNERFEYLRSLGYTQIGVIGGIPAGNVPQVETVTLNNVVYTRRTSVQFTDDPDDGLGEDDENGIIADYKTIRVETSWASKQGERSVSVIGRVSPPAVESDVPGGVLLISALNAGHLPVYDARVDIINTQTDPDINIQTYSNEEGVVSFIGAPASGGYQVTVSKPGYSTAQTYDASPENPNPAPRHLTVDVGPPISAPFFIDLVSTLIVKTYHAAEELVWQDSFNDANRTASSTNMTISGGTAHLSGPAPYPAWGALRSVSIAPANLSRWIELSWTDTTPVSTSITYRVYDSATGTLIPDAVLPGNATGFTVSPVDISTIPIETYPSLQLDETLETTDENSTPTISEWSVSYENGPTPFPNFSFTLRGNKTIGSDPAVYKFQQAFSSDTGASIGISDLEWDAYTISTPGTGYLIAEACQPQPIVLAPNTSVTEKIYVRPETANSVLVEVRGAGAALTEGASVRLEGNGFDITRTTSSCGQVYFENLAAGTYTITVTTIDYAEYTNPSVSIAGYSTLHIALDAASATLSVDTDTIAEGEFSTLMWNSSNATSCEASDGWSGMKATSGSEPVSPIVTTIYTITCTGPGGDSPPTSVGIIVTPPPDTQAPTTPTNLNATAISSSEIDLTWTASTDNVGVTGYKVYRGGVQVGTSTVTNFSDTGLSPSTLYSYTVSAYDAAGNVSAQSSGASATTQVPPDTQAPTTPTNLNATAISSSEIDLTWTASTDNVGVTGYKVYRGGVQVGTSTVTNFSDTGLSPSTLYSYTVSAYDAAGNVSAQSSGASATTQASGSSPTFVSEYETTWNSNTSPKTTSTFTAQAGDVLVAYAMTEGSLTQVSISGGSLTWTQRQLVQTFAYGWVSIWTATVPSTRSVSVTFTRSTGLGYFGGDVLVFRNAAIGASNSTTGASGAPSLSLTTTANNSTIVVVNDDWNAGNGSTRSWRTGAGSFNELSYQYSSGRYTIYGGYHPSAGAMGPKTVGLSAPASQKYSIAAIEITGI